MDKILLLSYTLDFYYAIIYSIRSSKINQPDLKLKA
jgi:hypothetical protein